jgi:1,2-dihydroxy-3-keto-5-methylthiopentene dioxygenase
VHLDDKVHALYCTAGDLLGLPPDTTHWFDMGTRPDFTAIRFFHNVQGWVGIPTGSDISGRFPDFDALQTRAQALGAA